MRLLGNARRPVVSAVAVRLVPMMTTWRRFSGAMLVAAAADAAFGIFC
jgi:hypothetical protein